MRIVREKLLEICRAFRIPGEMVSYEEIKMGNVNRTYKVNFLQEDGSDKSYMVQRINTYAFKEPEKVMSNIDIVTEHIRAKSPEKISLHFHHTAGRQNYISDESGFWRLFNYLPSVTYNTTEKEIDTFGMSCFALACELATRFLDDYILGDPYFNISYPEHNLVRTRCQVALAKDMLKKMDAMQAIVQAYVG